MSARYVVGVDLGTTNSALTYIDAGVEPDQAVTQVLPVPQVVQPGAVEPRPLLPSFLYLPGPKEQPAGSLALPWDADRDYAVGEFARNFGSQVPTRLVSSAKSWLCHPGIDRRQPLLPWKAPEGGRHVSPVQASTHYLKHLTEAWNHQLAKDVPAHRLEQQDIVLTVPASFDAVARELTVEAARAAGLENLTLLEEPQAAFYAWLEAQHEGWRKQVEVGDVVLVCDVGGGTSDFSLIAVSEESGNLALTRVAVGDHILLGGDNMDLALAHATAARLGGKLDLVQMQMLTYSCRQAKEKLFADPAAASFPVTVLGRGRSVLGGTLKGEVTRAELEKILLDGFFPQVGLDAEPQRARTVGLQELGLPYVQDAAVTRHLAHFLHRHADVLERTVTSKKKATKVTLPSAVLFNGGVLKADPIRQRLVDLLNRWRKEQGAGPVKELGGTDLDLAVARGSAYYGLVRRGRGVRIRGGTARAYYLGFHKPGPAVPGYTPPLSALCVAPFGMEEGSEVDVPGQEFYLVVGEPVEFQLLGSSVRRGDTAGVIVEEYDGEIERLSPLTTTLTAGKDKQQGRSVPVHLHSKVTEIGTLELWFYGRDGKDQWKLEFNVREHE